MTTIELFRWEGKRWGIEIKSECKECDLTTAMLQDMKEKEFKGKNVKIVIKPWFNSMFTSLKRGGWHAPVLFVDKKVFSQGVVPNRKKLAKRVLS